MRKHIIVTGPESSGKTTLSKALAKKLGAVWIPEYARGYLEAADRRAVAGDFPHFVQATDNLIEAGFQQQERAGRNPAVVIQDTGHEVLSIWQDDKFERTTLVNDAFVNASPDLYLLCHPDLPWEYDPLREDPHRRKELFIAIHAMLDQTGIDVFEVSGFGESRTEKVFKKLKSLL
ncbi:MAG: AAA family ATPase [Saprospiraceae bacterium]